MRSAYKVRAYPTPEQAATLSRTFGCVRLVWNTVLAWRLARYRTDGLATSYAEADRFLTALKRDGAHGFLYEVSSVPLQQVVRHQHAAFGNFFAGRARLPRFKCRTGRQSAAYTRSSFRWRDGCLYLGKMDGPLRFVWSWPDLDPADLAPTTVIVSRDPDGRWYVSLAVDLEDGPQSPQVDRAIGVDLGVKHFAVTSDGEKIANPRHLARKARNLARYQRRMARKQPGSSNRARARAKVARAHRKVRDARRDFLHRTSSRLVRAAAVIAVEDLNVAGMIRNRRLARAISDCGWGEFRRMLEYKIRRRGGALIVVDRWYPSSKRCSSCGHVRAELKLSTRQWDCPACRTPHDRDINAAKNILAAGLAVTACGGDVRHSGPAGVLSPAKQESRSVRVWFAALQGAD